MKWVNISETWYFLLGGGKQPYAVQGISVAVIAGSKWASLAVLCLCGVAAMAIWVEWMGWRYAFAPLALGPVWGIWAMARLRAHPDSLRLAGGRR